MKATNYNKKQHGDWVFSVIVFFRGDTYSSLLVKIKQSTSNQQLKHVITVHNGAMELLSTDNVQFLFFFFDVKTMIL